MRGIEIGVVEKDPVLDARLEDGLVAGGREGVG